MKPPVKPPHDSGGRVFEGLPRVPPAADRQKNTGFFMDSVSIATIQAATASVNALTGSLWCIFGGFVVAVCGYLVIRYTLRG